MVINPLVSIVIPVYNREKYILEAIQSAQSQTYPNTEIIIVDNSSTDNTWNLLQDNYQQDPKIRIFQNETNLGPVRNWARCFELAQGEYIKLLFSDDIILPNFISMSVAAFQDNVAFVMVGFYEFTNNEIILSKSTFQNVTERSITQYLNEIILNNTSSIPVSPGCAIFRTKDLKENLKIEIPNNDNLIFSQYGAGNDLLLYLLTAVKPAYSKVICIDEVLAKFRNHKDSITVSNTKKLKIYYDWSIWYFINNFYNNREIKKSFKTLILWRTYRIGYTKNLLLNIDGPVSIKYLAKKIYKTIIPHKISQT